MGFLRWLDRKLSRLNQVAYEKLPSMFLSSEGVYNICRDSVRVHNLLGQDFEDLLDRDLIRFILARNLYNVNRKRAFGLGPFISSDLRKAKHKAKKKYRQAVKDLNVTHLDYADKIWDKFYPIQDVQYELVLARFSASPLYFFKHFFEKYLRIFRLYLQSREELTSNPIHSFMLFPVLSDIFQTLTRIRFKNQLNLIDSTNILADDYEYNSQITWISPETWKKIFLLVPLYSIPSMLYYLINPFSFIRKTLEAAHQITILMTKFWLFRIPIDVIMLPLRFAVATIEACADSFWSLATSTLSFTLSPVTFLISAAWQTLRYVNHTFVLTDTETLQSLKIIRKIGKNPNTLREAMNLDKWLYDVHLVQFLSPMVE